MENLNIVLLGKTGHGKSTTGNTVLRENRFFFCDAYTSITKMVERGQKVIGRYNVQVFDTPGPIDTQLHQKDPKYIAKTCALMESMIATSVKDGGVHAFFLVLNIGTRLTEEEMSTIKILEGIFGSKVFNEFGVLVFTHGDNLEVDFSVWLAQKDEQLKELLAKFKKRVVVTINKGEFSGRRLQCSENMIEAAADLKKSKKLYNLNNYKMAEMSRTKLVVKSEKEELTKNFIEQINKLEEKINKFDSMNSRNVTDCLSKINVLRGEIKNASKGTEVLNGLNVYVENLEILVEGKKSKCSVL